MSEVLKIGEKLASLPKKQTKSDAVREAITQLGPQIKEARKKGYSWKEIADILKEERIICQPTLLKNIVDPEAKKRRQKRQKTDTEDLKKMVARATEEAEKNEALKDDKE